MTQGYAVLALTPGPSPNDWERGDWFSEALAGSPSPSGWERGLGGEGVVGELNRPPPGLAEGGTACLTVERLLNRTADR